MNNEKKQPTDKPVEEQTDDTIINYAEEYLKQTRKDFITGEYVVQ